MGKDVEVIYNGTEIFRLDDENKYGYDAKISSKGDGAFSYYSTTSNWDDHVHIEVDKNGNETYNRQEGQNHKWDHRQKGYILNALKVLSFEELQIVEAYSNNDYLKRSARIMLNSYCEELGPIKKLDY